MIKQYSSICILTFLTGCSSFTLTDTFNYSKGFLFGYDSDLTSIEDYNASLYSFASIKIGRGPASSLVLSNIDKQSYQWISADSISLFSSFGQIYKSEGLSFDFNYEPINIMDSSMHR
jgi:pantothenate kinase